MPVGEFSVGRSSTCNLALDDALVSRRHAIFHVTEEGVDLEDLGSRNGVQINGDTVTGRRPLKHLDRVVIGAQELLLMRVQQGEQRHRGARPTLAGMTMDLPIIAGDLPDEPTVHHKSASVLDRIADKALALGRFEEAERMLARRMNMMVTDAREDPSTIKDDTRRLVTHYAFQLAEGLKRNEWIDWVFELHDACEALPDAEVIEELHQVVRRMRYPGSSALRTYMDNLRARADSLDPGERFRMKRLEGVVRVIGA